MQASDPCLIDDALRKQPCNYKCFALSYVLVKVVYILAQLPFAADIL